VVVRPSAEHCHAPIAPRLAPNGAHIHRSKGLGPTSATASADGLAAKQGANTERGSEHALCWVFLKTEGSL
jgi:hypothetical protein